LNTNTKNHAHNAARIAANNNTRTSAGNGVASAPQTPGQSPGQTPDKQAPDKIGAEANAGGFAAMGLAPSIQRALQESRFLTPTPIQAQAIPPVLLGKDVLGLAQTGTGKTAAFALPIIQHLLARATAAGSPAAKKLPRAAIRALILAPTRELALQIEAEFRRFAAGAPVRVMAILGGVGRQPQVDRLARGVDIVVGTPGRVLDLIQTRELDLSHVTHFVLDEADRMFDMGFIRDIRKIIDRLPKTRQSLLFSATMPDEIAELSRFALKDPVRIEAARKDIAPSAIDQRVYFVDQARKRQLLVDLLARPEHSRTIVFTRTKHGANKVAQHLDKAGIPAEAIHGNKSQSARQRALSQFKDGSARVLVATDIAARGIDVASVSHVVNFDLPHVPEDYVHRIGRTARNGKGGIALSFCDPAERANLRAIERLTRQPMKPAA
jgi:ATP-dependent RNA helicase RhlE